VLQEQQQQQEEEEQAQKCDRSKMVTSCGMTRTSHCGLHLRARAEHMNNTNAHTTILTLMASPVCEFLQ
jgi:aspartate oxidase